MGETVDILIDYIEKWQDVNRILTNEYSNLYSIKIHKHENLTNETIDNIFDKEEDIMFIKNNKRLEYYKTKLDNSSIERIYKEMT